MSGADLASAEPPIGGHILVWVIPPSDTLRGHQTTSHQAASCVVTARRGPCRQISRARRPRPWRRRGTGTSSLVKILERWRSTVFSLSDSSRAIALLVLPVATRASTSCSRGVSGELPTGAPLRAVAACASAARSASSRARSGAAPSSEKTARAASNASAAPSRSPRSRQASAEEQAKACGEVGRADPLPDQEGLAERRDRATRIAFDASATAPAAWRAIARSTSRSNWAATSRSSVAAALRTVDVAGCDQDLDGRRQIAGSRQRPVRRVEYPSDRARGVIDPALGKPQEREARLRFHAEAAGTAVGFLRRGEVAAEPVNLALLVERLGHRLDAPAYRQSGRRRAALPPSPRSMRR